MHVIRPAQIDYEALALTCANYLDIPVEEAREDLDSLRALAEAGFQLLLHVQEFDAVTSEYTPKDNLPWE
ncbi:MAG: hypothetical protein GY822_28685 [Deltaproteobacteria bacterium]|nr:hypothetical protein [Deltaproteobacteria bacterium]